MTCTRTPGYLVSSTYELCQQECLVEVVWWQVSKAKDLLCEESKQHGLIVEREGKYVPVVDEPKRPKPKSQSGE